MEMAKNKKNGKEMDKILLVLPTGYTEKRGMEIKWQEKNKQK